MTDRYAAYERLKFDTPGDRILRITMDAPGRLNAADETMHDELGRIWKDVEADPDVSVAILCGAGKAFSAGGDFDMIDEMIDSFEVRARVWKEARDLVYNVINCSKPIVSAMQGPAVGAGLVAGLLADISIAAKDARIIDGHTRLGVAAGEPISGEEAERIGLVSLCVEADELQDKAVEVAGKLARGAPSAIRFTKYALNNWLRMMGPTFDTSLALEFLGFTGPEAQEGLASLREKRPPNFDPKSTL